MKYLLCSVLGVVGLVLPAAAQGPLDVATTPEKPFATLSFSRRSFVLLDLTTLSFRATIPFLDNTTVLIEGGNEAYSNFGQSISTQYLGAGVRQELFSTSLSEGLPFTAAVQAEFSHHFAKRKLVGGEPAFIDSLNLFEGHFIGSIDLRNKFDAFHLIPYSSVSVEYLTTQGESDTGFTLFLGAKSEFSESWQAIAELGIGDFGGFSLAAGYAW